MDVVESSAALGLNAPIEETAWLLIYRATAKALLDLVRENINLMIVQVPNEWDLGALTEIIDRSLESSELEISSEFFKRPKELLLVNLIVEVFEKWLQDFGITEVQAQMIAGRFPAYFTFALNKEWQERPKDYSKIQEALNTPFSQAIDRERGWRLYWAWLQKQVDRPMFAEAFGLNQVYVPLRGYYECRVEKQDSDRLREWIYQRTVVDLANELEKWLKIRDRNDSIRIITGSPGSGKSSFAKMFAAQQAELNRYVLFVPLQSFNLTEDLIGALDKFVKEYGFLAANPLDPEFREASILVIFDGLDELAKQGKVAAEVAQQFVDEVIRTVQSLNQEETRLQVIIIGRDLSVQEAESKFRQPKQILHLLSYILTREEQNEKNVKYIDEQNLLSSDQRQEWWVRYGKSKGTDYIGLPNELSKDNLTPITAQPLLNYLIALSYEGKRINFSQETNLNTIYADLLDSVYERRYEQTGIHKSIQTIDKERFIGVLEAIAIACWHGNGRTATVADIEKQCESCGLKETLHQFQQGEQNSKSSVTRLLAAFYFRESNDLRGNEQTFEFTHKSFGEYLTAKHLMLELQSLYEELTERENNFRKGIDKQEALKRWAILCGATVIDDYLFRFILDEVKLKKLDDVRNWQKMLCGLIETLPECGMPMELLNLGSFREMNRQAINAEMALLIFLNVCGFATLELSNIHWQNPESFNTWISRLRNQSVWNGIEINWLNLRNCELPSANLSLISFFNVDFDGANLSHAYLSGTSFHSSNLKNVNLTGANISNSAIESSIFTGSNLCGVNISRQTSISGSDFSEVDLTKANISNVFIDFSSFINADIRGINISHTNIQATGFINADISEANISNTNIDHSDFKGANLSKANISNTNIDYSDLENANFTQTVIQASNISSVKPQQSLLSNAILINSNFKDTSVS
ncbi:MAG: pentapeptide repeat-containing protein [Pseudanabaena sp.]